MDAFEPRSAPPADRLAAPYSHCRDLVRQNHRDRFLATLFAPSDHRAPLFALYAFDHEVGRVRDAVRQPLAGEIRLQWWRDALVGAARGDGAGHPVAAALLDTIDRFGLPRRAFLDLIEAHVFDLYDDPMPTLGDLEGYCGETSSAVIRLASLVLAAGADPGAAEAAGHAGVAQALTGFLRDFPRHASRSQVYLPRALLERHGVDRDDILAGRAAEGLRAALAEMRALARHHCERLAELRPTVTPTIAPAFLPAMLVPLDLARLERAGNEPLSTVVEVSGWRRQWALWRAARRIR